MRGKRSLSIVVLCGVALAVFLLTGPARLWGQRVGEGVAAAASDSFLYRLEIDGWTAELYDQCSGLGSRTDIEEQKAIDEQYGLVWQETPGALHWDHITLKRDSVISRPVWEWRRTVEQGRISSALKTGSIVVLGSNSQQEYGRWIFTNGWPARLSFNQGAEELVIVHDGLTLVTPGTGGTATKKR
jgi:phage tail-like protein